jgi:hypothetical protein
MRVVQNALSAEARAIILSAVAGNGRVILSTTQRHFCLDAGGKTLIHEEPRVPRTEATYQSAIAELLGAGFLASNGVDHYVVTSTGYSYADATS